MKRFAVSIIAALLAVTMLAGVADAARWKRQAVARTVSGAVVSGATVDVYLAGGTTPANVYEAPTGGSAVNRVTSDADGRYKYYVDAAEYNSAARFKEVITKGSASSTLDNIPIVRWDPTVPQTLAGELTITGLGNGVTFPDGTRMTSTAAPGSGVTALGDISIAADTDANGSGEITLSTQGVARARVPNAGGLEINDSGTWRQMATQDGAETLSNKTLVSPLITGFAGAKGHKQGLTPRYKDADELYIGSGVIEIDGTICELDAETAFDMDAALGTSFVNNLWYCFGFKKPASGEALTASELVTSQIMPTWDDLRKGWYLPAPHSGGVALSGGDYAGFPKENAFNLAWGGGQWASSQIGASVSGAACIGYDFGVGITCAPTAIFFAQSAATDYAIGSVRLQYSDNGADWYDHETVTITDPSASIRGEYITLSTPGDPHRYWRLLANDNPAAGVAWFVSHVHFISADTSWARIFNRFITDGSAQIDPDSKWSRDYYSHTLLTLLSDNTPAYAAAELISANVPAWGRPVRIAGYANMAAGAAGHFMKISDGQSISIIRMLIRAQISGVVIDGNFNALTDDSGQIQHQGSNTTYTQYLIYKTGDYLPSGM